MPKQSKYRYRATKKELRMTMNGPRDVIVSEKNGTLMHVSKELAEKEMQATYPDRWIKVWADKD